MDLSLNTFCLKASLITSKRTKYKSASFLITKTKNKESERERETKKEEKKERKKERAKIFKFYFGN